MLNCTQYPMEVSKIKHSSSAGPEGLGERIRSRRKQFDTWFASRITSQKWMSEAFVLSAALALAGGFQDAYTYMVRHNVYANAQTGNVVLMSTHLMAGDPGLALQYLFPLLSFAVGVFVTEVIFERIRYARRIHWRQVVLLLEMGILFVSGLVPDRFYTIANMLISCSCAMQVQAFRTFSETSAYASTMCIGNLRSGTQAITQYLNAEADTPEKAAAKAEYKRRALHYFGVILFFAIGAGIGGNICTRIGLKSIWIADLFLVAAYLLMNMDKYRYDIDLE